MRHPATTTFGWTLFVTLLLAACSGAIPTNTAVNTSPRTAGVSAEPAAIYSSPQDVFAALLQALSTNDKTMLGRTIVDGNSIQNPNAVVLTDKTVAQYKSDFAGTTLGPIDAITTCPIPGPSGDKVDAECTTLHVMKSGKEVGSIMAVKLNGSWILVDT